MSFIGHTIIFSTHNMASVEEICDDIALINHSEVVLKGDMRQIKEAHRTGLYELQTPDVLSVEPDSPFDIVRQEERAGIHSYLLKAHGDATGNQLVGYLAGKVERMGADAVQNGIFELETHIFCV